jgi:hypothetical protein
MLNDIDAKTIELGILTGLLGLVGTVSYSQLRVTKNERNTQKRSGTASPGGPLDAWDIALTAALQAYEMFPALQPHAVPRLRLLQ